ncbi:MAG TPA: DNA polymerase III subunit beta [Anaerolineaceae bacterium]|nr:DNA polymerase III subunit beta [Anaerolineaceae bacterium]
MNAKLLKRSVSELQRLTDKTAPLILDVNSGNRLSLTAWFARGRATVGNINDVGTARALAYSRAVVQVGQLKRAIDTLKGATEFDLALDVAPVGSEYFWNVTLQGKDKHGGNVGSVTMGGDISSHHDESMIRLFAEIEGNEIYSWMDQTKLRESLASVVWSVSDDPFREQLMDVHYRKLADGVKLAATDGFTLATRKMYDGWNLKQDQEGLIPGALVKFFCRNSGNDDLGIYSDQSVAITRRFVNSDGITNGGQFLGIKFNGWNVICQETEHQFPEYTPIIPRDASIRMSILVNRREMLNALTYSSKNLTVELRFNDKSSIYLTIANKEGFKVVSMVGAEYMTRKEDADNRIMINLDFLVNALESVGDSEFITMKIVKNTHPVLIESDDCSHINIIMPMHLQE